MQDERTATPIDSQSLVSASAITGTAISSHQLQAVANIAGTEPIKKEAPFSRNENLGATSAEGTVSEGPVIALV